MPRRLLLSLVTLVFVLLFGTSAHAATLADVRLLPDGSAEPPGDLLTAAVGLTPAEREPALRIRAFLIPADAKSAQRVLAAGEKNRTGTGEWELVQKLETSDKDRATRVASLAIPYAELAIPQGTHKLGYEVALLIDGKEVVARPTVLTQIKVGDKPRALVKQTLRRVAGKFIGTVTYFEGGRRQLGPNEALAPAGAQVTLSQPREELERSTTPIEVPGGFERKEIPSSEVKATAASAPLPAASAGWVPLAEIATDKQRHIRFITNRKLAAANGAAGASAGSFFTSAVDTELHYGHCVVNVPVTSHRKGQLEMPGGWWAPRDAKNAFQVESISAFDQQAFLRGVSPGDVLVFVHGYNNTFEGSVLRAAQFHYDLDFPGTTIAFSWPSLGNTFKYVEDTEAAAQSYKSLAEALRVLVDWRTAQGGNRRIHLVAHSLGNRVLMNGLYEFSRSSPPGGGRKPFGQIVLAAPDVGAAMFNNLMETALNSGEQVTYYYCQNDGALKLSQTQNNYEPVGLYPYFQRGLVTVNANAVDTTFMGHLYFAGSTQVLLDLELLLRHGLTPSQRMPPLADRDTLFGHEYWTFTQRAEVVVKGE